jgi:hypothetical protein
VLSWFGVMRLRGDQAGGSECDWRFGWSKFVSRLVFWCLVFGVCLRATTRKVGNLSDLRGADFTSLSHVKALSVSDFS